MPENKPILIEDITIYGGTQTRAETNDSAIDAYAESLESGCQFPPISVYFDGAKYWLADGFHRLLAHKRIGRNEISCELLEGSRSDALLHALGANATNGLYRTNADKRHAVEIALEEFPGKNNVELAKICAVSETMVRNARKRIDRLDDQAPAKATDRVRAVSDEVAGVERSARGGSGEGGEGSGGGGGGGSGKGGSSEPFGGNLDDIEQTANQMIRSGDIDNPFGVETGDRPAGAPSPFQVADLAIQVLGKIQMDDPDRNEALSRVYHWLERNLQQTEPALS